MNIYDSNFFESYLPFCFKYWRLQRNYTQFGLAKELYKNVKTIIRWESGETIPDIYTFYQLLFLLGIDSTDFITVPLPYYDIKVSCKK